MEPGASIRILDEDGNHLGWGLVEPDGAIAMRVIETAHDFEWNRDEVERRVDAALALRERIGDDGAAEACRLIHGEGDGLPGLAVDRLGDFLLVYRYARSVESWLQTLVDILVQRISPAGVYLQDRTRPVTADERRGAAEHLQGKTAPPEYRLQEDGLQFTIDVTAPVSPGLFLDLREGRRWLEELSADKSVLNLFSFTGSFGLRAVRGGASRVVNVDAAARSHARCRQNLEASGMDPEACEARVGDVFKHLERMRQRNERFDLVVVDPPPFSRVKGKVFSALKDWHELMSAVVQVVEPWGEVLAVSNASKLTEEELMHALGTGAMRARRPVRLIGERGLPPDFPVPPAFAEGRYLKIKRLLVP